MTNATKPATVPGAEQCKFCFWATLDTEVCQECHDEFQAEMARAAFEESFAQEVA